MKIQDQLHGSMSSPAIPRAVVLTFMSALIVLDTVAIMTAKYLRLGSRRCMMMLFKWFRIHREQTFLRSVLAKPYGHHSD